MKKQMLMTLIVSMTAALASAETRTFCGVMTEGPENEFSKPLFQGEVDLPKGKSVIFYRNDKITAFAQRSENGSLGVILAEPNSPNWIASAISTGNLVVLMSKREGVSVSCQITEI